MCCPRVSHACISLRCSVGQSARQALHVSITTQNEQIQRLIGNITASLPASSSLHEQVATVDVSWMPPSRRCWLSAQVVFRAVVMHLRFAILVGPPCGGGAHGAGIVVSLLRSNTFNFNPFRNFHGKTAGGMGRKDCSCHGYKKMSRSFAQAVASHQCAGTCWMKDAGWSSNRHENFLVSHWAHMF